MSYPKTMDYLIGQYINDWFILEARPNGKKGYVKVKCRCGNIREITGRSIRSNRSTNCGCQKAIKLRGRQRIPKTDSAAWSVYSIYKRKSNLLKMQFNLTIDEFKEITLKNCYYCTQIPINRVQKHKYIYYYNGIDRVDNSKGYVKENIVPCCQSCNTKKGAITLDMVKKINEFYA